MPCKAHTNLKGVYETVGEERTGRQKKNWKLELNEEATQMNCLRVGTIAQKSPNYFAIQSVGYI